MYGTNVFDMCCFFVNFYCLAVDCFGSSLVGFLFQGVVLAKIDLCLTEDRDKIRLNDLEVDSAA